MQTQTNTLMKQDPQLLAQHNKIFDEELIPHIGALFNFAMNLTNYHEENSNDLVQETYMKAYRFIAHYEPGTNAKAWLFKILKNAFINEYRKAANKPTTVADDEVKTYQDSDDAGYSKFVDLRDEIFQGMMGDEVTEAVNELPVDFRTVILLCDVEGFTYEEIAKIIDIPIGTVRSRLHRARNMLKEALTEYAHSMGYKDFRSKD